MEVFLTPEIVDAYLEMCLGTAVLRYPAVQAACRKCRTLKITSSYADEMKDLTIPIDLVLKGIQKEGFHGSKKLRMAFTQVNRIFLIAMWDVLKTTETYSKISTEKEIQFLRHIRNGCAHHNKFDIREKIEHPAQWRDKKIVESMNGSPVIPDFLFDGDVYLLLHDINNRYFK